VKKERKKERKYNWHGFMLRLVLVGIGDFCLCTVKVQYYVEVHACYLMIITQVVFL
jgi:hypothetical protein